MPVSGSAAISSARRAVPGAGRPAAPSASRWTTSRRSAAGRVRSRASSISSPTGEDLVDERVEHVRLVAQQRGEREHVLLGRGVDGAQGRDELAADPPARVRVRHIALVLTPAETPGRAVRRRLRAREPEQRPDEGPLSRAHAEQRAPARRGREPVEDRLDLVGRGVAGGDIGTARRRQARRAAAYRTSRAHAWTLPRPRARAAGAPRAGRRARRPAPGSGARRPRRPRRRP